MQFEPFSYSPIANVNIRVIAVRMAGSGITHIATNGSYRPYCGSGENTIGTRRRTSFYPIGGGTQITCKKCQKALSRLKETYMQDTVIIPEPRTHLPLFAANRLSLLGLDLQNQDLSHLELDHLNASNADLQLCTFDGSELFNARFYALEGYKTSWQKSMLHSARFNRADLRHASFANADLTNVSFAWADLESTNFFGAVCKDTSFYHARLDNALNILTYGPMPSSGRMVYAIKHPNAIYVQAGCFWGTLDQLENKARGEHEGRNLRAYMAFIEAAMCHFED